MTASDVQPDAAVRALFEAASIDVLDLQVRSYPDESVFVVYVAESQFADAASVGNDADQRLAELGVSGFVTVRKTDARASEARGPVVKGVHDPRASELARLLSARSRTSEIQPSLSYVRDTAANIAAVTAPRHQLIFGRRGVGKTALLVEAKRLIEDDNHLTAWVNIQTYRRESASRIFLYVAQTMLESLQVDLSPGLSSSRIASMIAELLSDLDRAISANSVDEKTVARMVPRVQRILKRYLESSGKRLYIFLDDFYYTARATQPQLLDMIHGCVRDCDAWLKIASIQYLTRWFQTSPPMGLQTGQDADLINLDVTLQDPARAKRFLEDVLSRYAMQVGIRSLTTVLSREALDRLVLASGGVPRDYLVLSASAITKAQGREKARLTGVQDVNQAAGDAAQAKLQELEDDLAANVGSAGRTVEALRILRRFCLEEQESTYYRVDFKDKEQHADGYAALTSLTELRLNHLIDPSLSEPHHAGERSEVYMLDLSQFSGSRLKHGVRVLDFVNGSIVSKKTAEKGSTRLGGTPRQLISILRAAPALRLEAFDALPADGELPLEMP